MADLRAKPKDRKNPYKGTTAMGVASGCPGGRGPIQMKPATPTRIDFEVLTPFKDGNGTITCPTIKGMGFLETWQKVSFFLESGR